MSGLDSSNLHKKLQGKDSNDEISQRTTSAPESNLERHRKKMKLDEQDRSYAVHLENERMDAINAKSVLKAEAKKYIEEIRNLHITSDDIDQAIKKMQQQQPDTSARKQAKKVLISLLTEMENVEDENLKRHKDLQQSLVDAEWNKIEKHLPDNLVLQSALQYAYCNAKLTRLPQDIIKILADASRVSLAAYSTSNKEIHENIVLNVQEILLKSDNYPKQTKSRLRNSREEQGINYDVSLSHALIELKECLKQAANVYLERAIKQIEKHLKENLSQ